MIFVSKNPQQVSAQGLLAKIQDGLATRIFMPDANPTENYKTVFSLTNDELEIVKMMEAQEGHFLLKHGDDSMIISLILAKLGHVAQILEPDQLTLTAMREIIAADGGDHKKDSRGWIMQLIDILQTIEEEEMAAQKEQARQEMIAKRKENAA